MSFGRDQRRARGSRSAGFLTGYKDGQDGRRVEGSPIEPLDFESWPTKVHQDPDVDGRRLQAVDDLGLMFWSERSDGLHFEQNAPVDEKVGREATDVPTSKDHFDLGLALSIQSVFLQRDNKGAVIDAFEKSSTELVTHFESIRR